MPYFHEWRPACVTCIAKMRITPALPVRMCAAEPTLKAQRIGTVFSTRLDRFDLQVKKEPDEAMRQKL